MVAEKRRLHERPGWLAPWGVGVEKLFSRDFTNEIRSQVIESSFAAGAEIHTNYCFGCFFQQPRDITTAKEDKRLSIASPAASNRT
jgi:hypothetical protein